MDASFGDLKHSSVNDVALTYQESGAGEPVVLIHGSSSDMRTWNAQMQALSSDFRVIRYSRRFARPNEEIEDGLDDQMLPHVDDLAALLSFWSPSPAHLVGHSWGAFIALLMAIEHPKLVRSLVLLEPPVVSLCMNIPPKPSEIIRLLLRRPATALALMKFGATTIGPAEKAYRRGDDETAMEIFGRGILGKSYYEMLSQDRLKQVWDNRKADRAQILGAGFPPLSEAMVKSVNVPVTLLVGVHSPKFLRRLSEYLQELLANSNFRTIERASHIMHEDNPEAVNSVIKAALRASSVQS